MNSFPLALASCVYLAAGVHEGNGDLICAGLILAGLALALVVKKT